MKTYLDCYPCFLRQALHAARLVNCDAQAQYTLMNEVLGVLQGLSPETTPPEIACTVHRLVRKITPVDDPYASAKAASTQAALSLYPRLKDLIDNSADPLGVAIRLSIAGNIIDFGVSDQHDDLWETVERVLRQPFAIDHEEALRDALQRADHVLFLSDNAGETVFDRLLIEAITIPVIYAVKGAPILNDATEEDAIAAGLDKVARIVSNGADAPGTILSLCTKAFVEVFNAAPLVIAKGQANYETLSDAGTNIFCLLQVKCPVIAADIGAPIGSTVVRQGRSAPPG